MYSVTEEEKAFLQSYNIADYKRPSIAADIAIFTVMEDEETKNIRKLAKKHLKILLIKRKAFPYKDYWALPGGFARPEETVYETAKRELFEETNVESSYLKLSGIYSNPDRDPRGWIVSNTFIALMDCKKCNLRAGSDAWEACFFDLNLTKEVKENHAGEDYARVETIYNLILRNEEKDITLTSKVLETKVFENFHEKVSYDIIESDGLAFDHGKIIIDCLLGLRRDAMLDSKILFDLVSEYFTLNHLQAVFELVFDEKLITPNFRRKIKDLVIETEKMDEIKGHRPAKLFKRNIKEFCQ